MHRFTFSLALALAGSVGMQSALAQEEPPYPEEGYDQPPEQGYDDPSAPPAGDQGYDDQAYDDSEVPYEETDAPYDDYDVEPYDAPSEEPYDESAGSIDTFYDALQPYGRWVSSPSYGQIWVPSRSVVGASFTPYATGGSWVYTDSGWMFESDWDWGWAPFHYGRWYREPRYGWVWVPGSVWAPAWVDWRFGGGVVGWAPLPPRHHRTVWVFARAGDLHRRHVHRYLVRDARRYYRSTTPVRHRVRSGRAYWYSGPRRADVERVGRVRVRPVRLRPPRAGVVARVRVRGNSVRQERVAAPRRRVITQSRRELPASRRQRPDVRRQDVRDRPDRRDVRQRPDRPDRPEVRQRPDRPDVRQRPDRRDVRQRPDRPEVRQRPDRPDTRPRPDPRSRPDARPQPDRRPEMRQRPDPRPRPDARPDRSRSEARPDRRQSPRSEPRRAPDRRDRADKKGRDGRRDDRRR